VREVYGRGTVDCQFEGHEGDQIRLWCTDCNGMRIQAEDGTLVHIERDETGIVGTIPETGTYILSARYEFVSDNSRQECAFWEQVYDEQGNYVSQFCSEYQIVGGESEFYYTIEFGVDLVDGVSSGSSGNLSPVEEVPQATTIPVRSEPITIPVDELCPSGNGQVQIRLRINALEIVDADEADGSSIVGGDEAYLYYGIGVDDGTEYWNLGENNEFLPVWSGDAAEHDVFTTFDPVERVVDCGSLTVIIIAADEDDGFFGSTSLGVEQAEMLLEAGESIELEPETEVIFSGTSTDGTYDYRVRYTVELTAAETIDAATFGQ
jgi:hypothetical protein